VGEDDCHTVPGVSLIFRDRFPDLYKVEGRPHHLSAEERTLNTDDSQRVQQDVKAERIGGGPRYAQGEQAA
jgi:hypothetical protein